MADPTIPTQHILGLIDPNDFDENIHSLPIAINSLMPGMFVWLAHLPPYWYAYMWDGNLNNPPDGIASRFANEGERAYIVAKVFVDNPTHIYVTVKE